MHAESAATAVLPGGDASEDELVSCLVDVEERNVALAPAECSRVLPFLSHDSRVVRRRAAGAVATMLTQGRIPTDSCRKMLSSSDAHARWGAAFALARAGLADEEVVDVALASLDSIDGDQRWAAEAVLVEAARESESLVLQLRELAVRGGSRSRKMALLCLCDCGVRDGALYRGALADDDPFVRLAALTSLARGGDRSTESLSAISAVAETDGDARVRRGAAAIFRRLTTAGNRKDT